MEGKRNSNGCNKRWLQTYLRHPYKIIWNQEEARMKEGAKLLIPSASYGTERVILPPQIGRLDPPEAGRSQAVTELRQPRLVGDNP